MKKPYGDFSVARWFVRLIELSVLITVSSAIAVAASIVMSQVLPIYLP